jgi:hypothetical protein
MRRWRQKEKGVFVEAEQLNRENAWELARWANNADVVDEIDPFTREVSPGLNIKTPQGIKRLSEGMYLVHFEGMFYLTRPTTFENNYDAMTPAPEMDQDPPRQFKDPFEGLRQFGKRPGEF